METESKMPDPTMNNIPDDNINWDEISTFIEDMLNPIHKRDKGWKIIKEDFATAHLQDSSVEVLHILYDDLYGFFFRQHEDRYAVWDRMEKYVRSKYGRLSEKALSEIIATYHIDDR